MISILARYTFWKKRKQFRQNKQQHKALPRSTAIFYFPDYSNDNAYQRLLYSAFPSEVYACGGSIEEALYYKNRASDPEEAVVFHLHWTAPILKNTEEYRRKAAYIRNIREFLNNGGLFFWTIHNVLPHDIKHRQLELDLRTELAELATRIHLFLESDLERINHYYAIQRDKVLIAPHGNYISAYPNERTRDECRNRFGFNGQHTVFLFFGQLRPYKGLDDLFTSFSKVSSRNDNLKLLVVGNPRQSFEMDDILRQGRSLNNVAIVEEFISDEHIQGYMNAADFVTLPYKELLTSGVLLLALSFGKIVIAPEKGSIAEVVKDGVSALIYDPSDPDALCASLERATNLSVAERQRISEASYTTALSYDWQHVSEVMYRAIREEWMKNMNCR